MIKTKNWKHCLTTSGGHPLYSKEIVDQVGNFVIYKYMENSGWSIFIHPTLDKMYLKIYVEGYHNLRFKSVKAAKKHINDFIQIADKLMAFI